MDANDKSALIGANVLLINTADSTSRFGVVADTSGRFLFKNIPSASYRMVASYIGYISYDQRLNFRRTSPDLGEIALKPDAQLLKDVIVKGVAERVEQKGDTTVYNASAFKVNKDANAQDLLEKMPNITIENGQVKAQGENVQKVTVDGREFFGDDATLALKNLPAEVIDKIQVFDRLSEQAQLTGFDDGNSQRSINIVTKSGVKNGQFGRVYAGYGSSKRYQAGGNMSFFSGNRRISLVGNFNNVNQQNFAGQDLLGVTSTGGGRGGGRGRSGGGADNFMVGQAPGISRTNAFGINYSDKWGEKLHITGSYFYNNRQTKNENLSNRTTTFSPDSVLIDNSSYNSTANDYNHRINLRFEYKLDSSNTIYYIPSLNFQNHNSGADYWSRGYYMPDDSTNTSIGRTKSERNGFNINNMLMYRHAFAKRGRTLFIALNSANNKNEGYGITDEVIRTFYTNNSVKDSTLNQKTINNTNSNRYVARIGYTEPVSINSMIEINYNTSVQKNNADNYANRFDGTDYTIPFAMLSNVFDNKTISNSAGISYRIGQSRDNQLSFGIDFQNTKLQSDRVLPTPTVVDQSFNNFLPNMRWMKKMGRYSNLRLFYRASTDFPSINQLQDVVNLNSQLRPSVGNPSLRQTYTNYISGRYTYTNTQKNNIFFVNVSARATQNYISNATYLIRGADSTLEQGVTIVRNAQLSKPINLNGYRSLYSMITYSAPIKFIKSNINLNAGVNYERRPGQINYRNTVTENLVYNGGLGISSNVSEYVDYSISYNVAFNNTKSNANANHNNRFVNQGLGLQLNLLSKSGWILQNDVNYQSYTGLTLSGTQNYWLWNAGIGKKFLKNNAGEIKLSVFDLLNQNQSYARIIGDNYFEDTRNLVLRQYFMLTFTYSLKNFGRGRASSSGNERREWRRGGMGGPAPDIMHRGGL
ncbi:MAG TPA: hypothetical protein DCM71_23840 [Runella sp.]|nr:hypothetical protein [Runella sp.]